MRLVTKKEKIDKLRAMRRQNNVYGIKRNHKNTNKKL